MELKKCETLEEVRSEIDRVDEMIISLIALRKDYIKQLGHLKNTVDEIKDGERVKTVMNRARNQALSLGLSPVLITDLYTRMIDEMVQTEVEERRNTKGF